MSWEELRTILNDIAADEDQKGFLDVQVLSFGDTGVSFPVHLSQSRVDGELILLPMAVEVKK